MDHLDESFNADGPEPSRYPVTYKVVPWVRGLMILLATSCGGGWTYLVMRPALVDGRSIDLPSVLVAITVGGFALCAYFVWWALTARIVLYADRFEQHKPFVHRVLRLGQITGRMTSARGGYPMIVPRDGFAFSIDTTSYGLDDRFDAWWRRLPDARQVQDKEEAGRVSQDASLGATPAERLATDARRKKLFGTCFTAMLLASMVVGFGGLLMMSSISKPWIALQAVFPWICFAMGWPYRDRLRRNTGFNPMVAVGLVVYFPAFCLGVEALDQSDLLDGGALAGGGVLAGLPLLLALAALTNISTMPLRRKLPGWLVMAFITSMHGAALLALGNRLLDEQPAQIFRTTVTGKHLVRGRGGPTHMLELAGWGPEPQGTNLRVGSARYYAAHTGDVVCMGLHVGRLGYPWMRSAACPADGKRAAPGP